MLCVHPLTQFEGFWWNIQWSVANQKPHSVFLKEHSTRLRAKSKQSSYTRIFCFYWQWELSSGALRSGNGVGLFRGHQVQRRHVSDPGRGAGAVCQPQGQDAALFHLLGGMAPVGRALGLALGLVPSHERRPGVKYHDIYRNTSVSFF